MKGQPRDKQLQANSHRLRFWTILAGSAVAILLLAGFLIFEVILPAIAGQRLLAIGSDAPSTRLATASGASENPAGDSQSRLVVISFVSATCSDCQAVAPSLCAYAQANPQVLVIASNADDGKAVSLTPLKATNSSCARLTLLSDPNLQASAAYHVLQTPTFYALRRGKIVGASTGNGALAELESQIGSNTK